MSTWTCRSKGCPTHREPTDICNPGTWVCGRIDPPCTTHPKPNVPCSGGTAWNCGNLLCPGIHPSLFVLCPTGFGGWSCGRVKDPCPGHKNRSDHCALRGSYLEPGLGARKQALFGVGGQVLDLAVAMLETNTMQASFYPYGDAKKEDAANFGIFKQNWLMIRTSMPIQFKGLKDTDFNRGAVLNNNLALDVQTLHESQKKYGMGHFGNWWSTHRGGESGLRHRWPKHDIRSYQEAVFWIRDQINKDPRFLSDDTRFWVDVPPV